MLSIWKITVIRVGSEKKAYIKTALTMYKTI